MCACRCLGHAVDGGTWAHGSPHLPHLSSSCLHNNPRPRGVLLLPVTLCFPSTSCHTFSLLLPVTLLPSAVSSPATLPACVMTAGSAHPPPPLTPPTHSRHFHHAVRVAALAQCGDRVAGAARVAARVAGQRQQLRRHADNAAPGGGGWRALVAAPVGVQGPPSHADTLRALAGQVILGYDGAAAAAVPAAAEDGEQQRGRGG